MNCEFPSRYDRLSSGRVPGGNRLLAGAGALAFLAVTLPLLFPSPTLAQARKTKPMTGPKVMTTRPMMIRPAGPKPSWAPNIDPQMQAVIEELGAQEAPPFDQLSPFQVRNAILPAEAVMSLLHKTGVKPMPPKVDIAHRVLHVGPPEGILVRTYTPNNKVGMAASSLPVIVYYHGGGWVIADLETYQPSAIALAEKTGAMVVSVAYRQAPEHKFPAAHDDAFAAYKWVVENTRELGGDPNRIAIAGESAGGNLAVAVSMMARDQGVRLPVHILSVYPIADGNTESSSYTKYAKAKPLNKPFMEWFFKQYLNDADDAKDPRIAIANANLKGLPPTTIINAQIDPLQAEGEYLAQQMKKQGVSVTQKTYMGVTHEFFGMSAILEQAEDAQNLAARRLRQAFAR